MNRTAGLTVQSVRDCLLVFGLVGSGCLLTGLIDTTAAITFPARQAPSRDVGPAPQAPSAPSAPSAVSARSAEAARTVPAARVNPAPRQLALGGRNRRIPVVPVGVAGDGQLQVPDNPRTVGWWSGGASPGDARGSVVIDGHLDSADSGLGVFTALLSIRVGQLVTVRDTGGRTHPYRVTARRSYPRDRLPGWVFQTGGTPRLLMLTCGGGYDARRHHYRDTVVVVAGPVT